MTPVKGTRSGRHGVWGWAAATWVAAALAAATFVAAPGIRSAWSEEKPAKESPIVQVGAETGEKSDAKKDEKIAIKAFMALDRLPAGGTCRVAMVINIEDGWHINTNPAKPKLNIPTVFSVKSKRGTVLKDVKYPEGLKRVNKTSKEQETAYESQVTLYGTLHIPADAAGGMEELDLEVRYQPCNDDTCLPPRTVKLSGKIPVAAPGDEVKPINGKYFPATAQK